MNPLPVVVAAGFVKQMLGLSNVREATAFPRDR